MLYGEGIGKKIQKGGGNYNPTGNDFILFDVVVGNLFLRRPDVEEIAPHFGLKTTPVIGVGTLHEMMEKVALGLTSQWGDFVAEGIVARPIVEFKDRRGNRIITKIKGRDFSVTSLTCTNKTIGGLHERM